MAELGSSPASVVEHIRTAVQLMVDAPEFVEGDDERRSALKTALGRHTSWFR
jgi:hypothetical protein